MILMKTFADRDDLLGELDVLARELGDVHEGPRCCPRRARTRRTERAWDLPGAWSGRFAWVRAKNRHGSSCVAFSDARSRSRSVDLEISTVTSWPTSTTRRRARCSADSSEIARAGRPRAQVDERTEVDDRGDDTLCEPDPCTEVVEERGARLGLRLLEQGAAREQRRCCGSLVELGDLRLDLLAEVRREVADVTQLDEREGGGQEPRRPMSTMSRPDHLDDLNR